MTTAFVSAQCLAFAFLLWKKYQYPAFMMALACWSAQSIIVSAGPKFGDSQEVINYWLRGMWTPCEAWVILVTAAACLEAARRAREYVVDKHIRFQLRVATWGLPIAVVGFTIMAVVGSARGGIDTKVLINAPAADIVAAFRALRGWIWLVMAVSMATTVLILLRMKVNVPAAEWCHLGILSTLIGAHAGICWLEKEPPEIQAIARDIYRGTVIVCCLGWAIAASRFGLRYPAKSSGLVLTKPPSA